jgi:hypothetical protein
MDATGTALIQAWELFLGNSTDALDAKLEMLLPTLLDAGYVETNANTWRFTKGVARADALTKDSGDSRQRRRRLSRY